MKAGMNGSVKMSTHLSVKATVARNSMMLRGLEGSDRDYVGYRSFRGCRCHPNRTKPKQIIYKIITFPELG